MAGATGLSSLNFGVAPGTNYVDVLITGQTLIGANSHCEAFLMASTSADHTDLEHLLSGIRLTCGNITPGASFRIYAHTELRLTGSFIVHWVWAD